MQTPNEMRTRIIDRAVNDAQLRKALLADPNAAVTDELGVAIPDSLTIEVHEDSGTTAHVVLPPPSKLSPDEFARATGGIQAWAGGPEW